MANKKAIFPFDSNKNQLPYDGTPATYADWLESIALVEESSGVWRAPIDESFDSDGVPVQNYVFSFSWTPANPSLSPVYLRYRVRDDRLGTQSNWSIPKTVHTAVRYAVYKRRVAATPKSWTLVEVTKKPSAGPYQENWAGRVQYAVCIHHQDAVPSSSEGVASATDFTNRYVLFATDPSSVVMNTRRFILGL